MAEILVEVRPKLTSRTAGELAPKPAMPEPMETRIGELAEALKELSIKIGNGLDKISTEGVIRISKSMKSRLK